MARIGMGTGGIASSTTFYHTLSKDFTDDIERVAKSLVALQDQLESLAGVVLQNRRGLDLLDSLKWRTLPLLEWRMLLLYKPVRNSQEHGPTAKGTNHKTREKLANSWGNWSNIWSWPSWLLPLTGPHFMLFAALLFGPCIFNAITQFITSQTESTKLQMVIVQYSPINDGELWMSYQNMGWCFLQRGIEASKRGNEEEKLNFYSTSFSFCLCNSACSLQSMDHVGHVVSESGDLEY